MWAFDEGLTYGSTQSKWLLDGVFNTKMFCVFIHVPERLPIPAIHVSTSHGADAHMQIKIRFAWAHSSPLHLFGCMHCR